jgi:hypothetical protein
VRVMCLMTVLAVVNCGCFTLEAAADGGPAVRQSKKVRALCEGLWSEMPEPKAPRGIDLFAANAPSRRVKFTPQVIENI